jgi:hypothetical protein
MNNLLADCKSFFRRTREILRSERVRIEMSGDEHAYRIYKMFKAPHRLLPLVGRKCFGTALLHVPTAAQGGYLKGGTYREARRKHRRAVDAGFTFRTFRSAEYIDQMMDINRSADFRQGRPMAEEYRSRDAVSKFCAEAPELYGAFDRQGVLKAYAQVVDLGEVLALDRLLGHADALPLGVMYLLLVGYINDAIQRYRATGLPIWAQYDMFWGASPGLRQFKRELGFRPYRVSLRWQEHPKLPGGQMQQQTRGGTHVGPGVPSG